MIFFLLWKVQIIIRFVKLDKRFPLDLLKICIKS
jgi:hypothetical protein